MKVKTAFVIYRELADGPELVGVEETEREAEELIRDLQDEDPGIYTIDREYSLAE